MSYPLRSLPQKISVIRRTLSGGKGPNFASLFITRKCNLACRYCRSYKKDDKDLDKTTWFQIIDRLFDWGVRVFSMTGGEPLIHPDIYEIIDYISTKKKAVPWLISNFKAVNDEVLTNLKSSGLTFLTGSLDTLGTSNKGAALGILEKMESAKRMGFFCSTITVITNKNIHEINDIVEAVTSRGILFDMGLCHNVGGIFSSSDPSFRISDDAQLHKLKQFLLRKKRLTGMVSPSIGYLKRGIDHYKNMDWKCSWQRDAYLVVGAEGHLLACQEWPTPVRVLDIESPEDPRWRAAKRAEVEKCGGCAYGCYYQKEHIHPLDVFYGLVGLLRS